MRHAEWSGSYGTVSLNRGQWTMQATPGTLTLRAEAANEANLHRIQDMLTTRLEKFGRREHLTVDWQPLGGPAADSGQAGTPPGTTPGGLPSEIRTRS